MTVGYRAGKQIRKFVYGRTQADAVGKLRAAQHAAAQGMPITNEKTTTAQFLLQWMEDLLKISDQPSTYES